MRYLILIILTLPLITTGCSRESVRKRHEIRENRREARRDLQEEFLDSRHENWEERAGDDPEPVSWK